MLLRRVQLLRTNSFPKWRTHEIFKPHIWERLSRSTLILNMKSEREILLRWPWPYSKTGHFLDKNGLQKEVETTGFQRRHHF